MRDYLTLGSTPCDEDCAQVGADNYGERSRVECNVYARQLKRMFPNGSFGIKSFPHDFGSYREVVAYFDDNSEESVEIAFQAENNLPENWDSEALAELETILSNTFSIGRLI